MDTETGEMIVKRVSVPIGLEELMEGLVKEVLLKKPDDIYLFAAQYFAHLLSIREKIPVTRTKTLRTVQSLKEKQEKPEKHVVHTTSRLSKQYSIREDSPTHLESPIISQKPKMYQRNELRYNRRRHTGPPTVIPNNQQVTIRRKYAKSVSGEIPKPVVESVYNRNKVQTKKERSADESHERSSNFRNERNNNKLPVLSETKVSKEATENNNRHTKKENETKLPTKIKESTTKNIEINNEIVARNINATGINNVEIKDKSKEQRNTDTITTELLAHNIVEEEHIKKQEHEELQENSAQTIAKSNEVEELEEKDSNKKEVKLENDDSRKLENHKSDEKNKESVEETRLLKSDKTIDDDEISRVLLSSISNTENEGTSSTADVNEIKNESSLKLSTSDEKLETNDGNDMLDKEVGKIKEKLIKAEDIVSEKGFKEDDETTKIKEKLIKTEEIISEKETKEDGEVAKTKEKDTEVEGVKSERDIAAKSEIKGSEVKENEETISQDSLEFRVETESSAKTDEKTHNLLVSEDSTKENENVAIGPQNTKENFVEETNKYTKLDENKEADNFKSETIAENIIISSDDKKLTKTDTFEIEEPKNKEISSSLQSVQEKSGLDEAKSDLQISEISKNQENSQSVETTVDIEKVNKQTELIDHRIGSEQAEEKLFVDGTNDDNVSTGDQKTDMDIPSIETDYSTKKVQVSIDTRAHTPEKHILERGEGKVILDENLSTRTDSSVDKKTDVNIAPKNEIKTDPAEDTTKHTVENFKSHEDVAENDELKVISSQQLQSNEEVKNLSQINKDKSKLEYDDNNIHLNSIETNAIVDKTSQSISQEDKKEKDYGDISEHTIQKEIKKESQKLNGLNDKLKINEDTSKESDKIENVNKEEEGRNSVQKNLSKNVEDLENKSEEKVEKYDDRKKPAESNLDESNLDESNLAIQKQPELKDQNKDQMTDLSSSEEQEDTTEKKHIENNKKNSEKEINIDIKESEKSFKSSNGTIQMKKDAVENTSKPSEEKTAEEDMNVIKESDENEKEKQNLPKGDKITEKSKKDSDNKEILIEVKDIKLRENESTKNKKESAEDEETKVVAGDSKITETRDVKIESLNLAFNDENLKTDIKNEQIGSIIIDDKKETKTNEEESLDKTTAKQIKKVNENTVEDKKGAPLDKSKSIDIVEHRTTANKTTVDKYPKKETEIKNETSSTTQAENKEIQKLSDNIDKDEKEESINPLKSIDNSEIKTDGLSKAESTNKDVLKTDQNKINANNERNKRSASYEAAISGVEKVTITDNKEHTEDDETESKSSSENNLVNRMAKNYVTYVIDNNLLTDNDVSGIDEADAETIDNETENTESKSDELPLDNTDNGNIEASDKTKGSFEISEELSKNVSLNGKEKVEDIENSNSLIKNKGEESDKENERKQLIKNTAENLISSTLAMAETGLIEHKVKKFLNDFIDTEKNNTTDKEVSQYQQRSKSFDKLQKFDNKPSQPVNGLKRTTSFDSSKLREELKKVEEESKFVSFKNNFNPFLLRKEIEEASENKSDEPVLTSQNFRRVVEAVLTIQKSWRSFQRRKKLNKETNQNSDSDKNETKTFNEQSVIKETVPENTKKETKDILAPVHAVLIIQRIWRGYKARKHLKAIKNRTEKVSKDFSETAKAALTIQRLWRGYKARKKLKSFQKVSKRSVSGKENDFATTVRSAIIIQKIWRGYQTRKKTRSKESIQKKYNKPISNFPATVSAALRIQRIWRGYEARKSFKALKNKQDIRQKGSNEESSKEKEEKNKNSLLRTTTAETSKKEETESKEESLKSNTAIENKNDSIEKKEEKQDERRIFSAESTDSVKTVIFNENSKQIMPDYHNEHYSGEVGLLLDEILDYPTGEEEHLLDNYQSKLLDKISGKEEDNKFDDINAFEKIISPKRIDDIDLESLKEEVNAQLVPKNSQSEKMAPGERKLTRTLSSKLEILEEEGSNAEEEDGERKEPVSPSSEKSSRKSPDAPNKEIIYTYCSEPTPIPCDSKLIDGKPLTEHVEIIPTSGNHKNRNGKLSPSNKESVKKENQIDLKVTSANKESTNRIEAKKSLYSGEVHETLVIPLPSQVKNKLKTDKTEDRTNQDTIGSHDEPNLSQISYILSNAGINSDDLHDTVVLPINEQSIDTGRSQPISVQLCQAPGQVYLIIILPPFVSEFDQDAENLMTPTGSPMDVTGTTTAARDAHDPEKADLRTDEWMDSIAGSLSPPENMESGKRRKTDGVNMEAQAATKIQAGFRGYQVRKQLKLKNGSSDMNPPKKSTRSKSTGLDTSKKQSPKFGEIEEQSAVKIQAGIRGFLVRRRQKKHNTQQA